MKSVLAELGIDDGKKQKNSLLSQLYQIPKKDRGIDMPKFQYPTAGQICQADLLFMPTDKGYKYMLVVIDNGSRLVDAEPLKSKESKAVVSAFQMIFSRGIVAMPKVRIEVDAGSEFKAGVAKYFQNAGVQIRVAQVGRHRMQALVERANQTIGSIAFKRMTAQEILTGSVSKEWIKDLPKIVKALNNHIAKRELKRKKKAITVTQEKNADPLCKDGSCNLLSIGDKVRVALEFPMDLVTGAKLHGTWRSSDIRWNPKIRTIKEVLITPNQPPMYLLEGSVGDRRITPVAYTKNQLSLVSPDEKAPSHKVIRGKVDKYIVEKLLERKKIKNKIHFLVKWEHYPDPKDYTYEPRSTLIKEVPNLVRDFENSH